MAIRALGWIQDSTDISKLKRIVRIFINGSEVNMRLREVVVPAFPDALRKEDMLRQLASEPVRIEFGLLKGRGPLQGETRATASCSGIAQAVLPAQNGRPYQSDWATNSFLVWAIAIGFLDYAMDSDLCSLSDLGLSYAMSDDGETDKQLLRRAFLTYPPVCRILQLLLADNGHHLTKFELGNQFGFIGEKGFTCFSQRFILEGIRSCAPGEVSAFLRNTEGTADKYVRTICSWLEAVGWVEMVPKTVSEDFHGTSFSYAIGHSYRLTFLGRRDSTRAFGGSRHGRSPKKVSYSMLSPKASDSGYRRFRRALLIQYLNARYRSLAECVAHLASHGIAESEDTVLDDIKGFLCIGLNVEQNGARRWKINDVITGLTIPRRPMGEEGNKSDIEAIKDRIRLQLRHLNHRYLALIDLGFDSNREDATTSADRQYELMTADLLTAELQFSGRRLGDTRKPDVCVFYGDKGLIIDNKAYARGYTLPMHQADEMVRYIDENQRRDAALNPNEWWKVYDAAVRYFHFVFVSGCFSAGFRDRLNSICNRTGVEGAAVNSANLLLLAERIKSNALSYDEAFDLFGSNDEIVLSDEV